MDPIIKGGLPKCSNLEGHKLQYLLDLPKLFWFAPTLPSCPSVAEQFLEIKWTSHFSMNTECSWISNNLQAIDGEAGILKFKTTACHLSSMVGSYRPETMDMTCTNLADAFSLCPFLFHLVSKTQPYLILGNSPCIASIIPSQKQQQWQND